MMFKYSKQVAVILMFLLAPFSHADTQKLFCFEEDASGFSSKFERGFFKPKRYVLEVDFDRPSLIGGGNDIGFYEANCIKKTWSMDNSKTFSCSNSWNTHTFVLDLNSFVFVRSAALIGDSLLVAHGKCETF